MTDERHADETQPDQAAVQDESELVRPTEASPESGAEGVAAEDEGDPHKSQWDLTADDLRGDARSDDDD